MTKIVSDEELSIQARLYPTSNTALMALELISRRAAERDAVPLAWLCATREGVTVTLYEDQAHGDVTPLYGIIPAAPEK